MTGPTRTSPPWSRLRWPSLNGVCGGPDHVDHEGGLREHGHVAAVGLMDAGAHPLRDEALQLGMNGVVVLATMYQVGFDLQAVPSIFWLNRSTVGTPWVAQTTFCSCSERSPAKYWTASGRIHTRPSATSMWAKMSVLGNLSCWLCDVSSSSGASAAMQTSPAT